MKKTKSKIFKVAAVEFQGKVGQFDDNLRRVESWCKKAAARGVDLIVFPEGNLTGLTFYKYRIVKCCMPFEGSVADNLSRLAKKYNLAVSCGFAEVDGDHYYISQAAALPNGDLHLYRKRFGGEPGYTRSDYIAPFKFRGITVGTIICSDACIYELYRAYAKAGTNLLLKPNCAWEGPWLADGGKDIKQKLKLHHRKLEATWESDNHFAATNGMAMIACNTIGDNGQIIFPGGSWYSDGDLYIKKRNKMILEKARLRERMLVGELNVSELLKKHRKIKYQFKMIEVFYTA